MTTDLSLRQSAELTPAEFEAQLTAASAKAQALARLAESQHLYTPIGASKHLRVEGWLTIGRAYGYTVGTGGSMLIGDPVAPLGVRATAYVYDQAGLTVGQADGFCMREEENWTDKPIAQLAGMAQTRAVSRALRQLLAWVVVLAGYSPTPAEEMEASTKLSQNPREEGYGICPEHGVPWFKRGKMRQYAHPKENGGWCNKADWEKAHPSSALPAEDDPIPDREPPAQDAHKESYEIKEGGPGAEDAPQQGQEGADTQKSPRTLNELWSWTRERGWSAGTVHALFRVPEPRVPEGNVGSLVRWLEMKGHTLEQAWKIILQQLGTKV